MSNTRQTLQKLCSCLDFFRPGNSDLKSRKKSNRVRVEEQHTVSEMALAQAASLRAEGIFDYKEKGNNWPQKYAKFEFCDGKEQSPIDLTTKGVVATDRIEIKTKGYTDYSIERGKILRMPLNVQVPVKDGELHLTQSDGTKSVLQPVQFHFHAPAEHTIEGKEFDLELHIVHVFKDENEKDARLGAVIGVFFDRSAGNTENPFLESLWDEGSPQIKISLNTFLSSLDMQTYWSYDGSLTTPPCFEGIKWTVLKEVQPISDAQLDKFKALWADNEAFANGNGNNRAVQPLNDRTLYFTSSKSPNHQSVAMD